MLRPLYRCVLRLHPAGFRTRFADEMLSIFDHAVGRVAAFRLLLDGLASLARQWTLRSEFWHEISPTSQPASDGIPSFYTIGPFRPRAGAIIHGLVLSTAVFCLTCFAIKYSWIRVLHVHIPEVQFDSPRSIQSNTGSQAREQALKRESVRPYPEGNRSIATLPAVPSAGEAPGHALSTSIPAQNSVAQSSATGGPESQVSSGAQTAVEVAGQPKRGPLQVPVKPRDSQPSLLTLDRSGNPQPQAQLPRARDATNTINRAGAENVTLDAAERQRVIHGAVANLTKYYVDPDIAQKMADALLAHEKSGDDHAATDGEVFADLLTRQMVDLSHDKYVMMVYSTIPSLESPPAPTPEDVALYRKEMKQNNCTIEAVKISPHNIGYLKFNEFPDAAVCGATVSGAMASLNHADAIIFDLRDNRGGYANMVAFIATYLFDHPTHLNDFYNRSENSTEQSWTLSAFPGNSLADKPAFVLTSPTTFSAAEGFSYDLKVLKRATLVGETTSGHGHMGMGHRIDDHFTIRIPGVKVINPISETNWEGTGVEPDVKVKAQAALETAEKLAEKKLQTK